MEPINPSVQLASVPGNPMQITPASTTSQASPHDQTPSVPQGSTPTGHILSSKGALIALAIVILAVFALGSYYLVSKNKTSTAGMPVGDTGIVVQSLGFNGIDYIRSSELAGGEGADVVSTSYEWAPSGETLEKWTSLITTHKIAPKDVSQELSAEVYAKNVAALNEQQGAVLIETSIINTQDAIDEAGVDPSNPPYLLVYAYPSQGSAPIEVDIQKVLMGEDGRLNVFVYAYTLAATTEKEIDAHFQSEEFAQKRIEVIKTPFPY